MIGTIIILWRLIRGLFKSRIRALHLKTESKNNALLDEKDKFLLRQGTKIFVPYGGGKKLRHFLPKRKPT